MLSIFVNIFLLNMIVAVGIGLISWIFSDRKWNTLIFLTIIGVFVPFGWVVATWLTIFYRVFRNKQAKLEIRTFDMPEVLEKSPNQNVYSEGWAQVRLQDNRFDKSERIKALNMINKSIDATVNKINWLLLFDKTDELRLYAFSLLEKQQNLFNRKIYQLLTQYKKPQTKMQTAEIEKQLAMQYWEMIRLNLVEKELYDFILNKSLNYALQALPFLKNDPDLWCLLAHIHFSQGKNDEALEALKKADTYQAKKTITLPLFAEYCFNQKKFPDVRQYLSQDNSFWELPQLSKVVEFWCTNAKTP